MKWVAFLFGAFILLAGSAGVVAPSILIDVARQFNASGAFYPLAAIRVAFGLILIYVSPLSRVPKALRILGYIIVTLGVTTALAGRFAAGQAEESIDVWSRQTDTVVRLTSLALVALGGFVTYACAPMRPKA